MKKVTSTMLGILLLAGIVASGCSSKPGEEELKQLEELKAEVASLEQEVQKAESEKASLQKSIADKDVQLKKCNDDKVVVEQRLKGM